MAPNEIREQLRKRPFQPFKVFMSDGSSFEIRHPEMAYVSLTTVVIARKLAEDELPDRLAYCDVRHVTRIEPLHGADAA